MPPIVQQNSNIVNGHDVKTHLNHAPLSFPRVDAIIDHLKANAPRIVPFSELAQTFWNTDDTYAVRSLHVHISRARTALGDSAREPRFIRTWRNRGYQWIAFGVSATDTPKHSPTKTVRRVSKDDLAALYESGLSLRQIGERFGVTDRRVYQWMITYDIPTRTPRQARNLHIPSADYLRLALKQHGTCANVAAEFGVTRDTVWKWLIRHGIPKPDRRARAKTEDT